MRSKPRLLFFLPFIGVCVMPLHAQTPMLLNYQGRLVINGNPSQGIIESIRFSIYDAMTGGKQLWPETADTFEEHQSVPVNNGVFNVLLGSIRPMPARAMAQARNLFLQINVPNRLITRLQISSVAFANKSTYSDTASVTLANGHFLNAQPPGPDSALFVNRNGDVGIGTANPTNSLHVKTRSKASFVEIESPGALPAGIRFHNGVESNNSIFIQGTTGALTFQTQGTDRMVLDRSGNIALGQSSALFVNSNGNVGIGTQSPQSNLDVRGGDNSFAWGGDHSNSGYVRLGNMQICWGAFAVDFGSNNWTQGSGNNHSYIRIPQAITFQEAFQTPPVITLSVSDTQVADRSAYVSSFFVTQTEINEILLSSPRTSSVPKGAITLYWQAMGVWR